VFDDAFALVQRQRLSLERRERHELLFAIPRLVAALDNQPHLRVHLDDLRAEAEQVGAEYIVQVEPLKRKIMRAWEHLPIPRGDAAGQQQRRQQYEQYGAEPPHARVALSRSDSRHLGPVSEMGELLEKAVASARQAEPTSAALRPIVTESTKVSERLYQAAGVLNAQAKTPAVALARLTAAAELMPLTQGGPGSYSTDDGEDCQDATAQLRIHPAAAGEALKELAFSAAPSSDARSVTLQILADDLMADACDVLDELEARLGSVRSRKALVDRFAARSERYDRQRLRTIAHLATGHAEAALRDEFARYLFDAGLEPLTEVSHATTRSDILDLTGPTLLVEAKQYRSGAQRMLTKLVQEAYLQVLDTVTELPTTTGTHEAFVVIFRLAGGRLVLPAEPVVAGSVAFYFRLVDLAEPTTTGSSATDRAVPLSVEDIAQLFRTAREQGEEPPARDS
jgi:hypothetical protein